MNRIRRAGKTHASLDELVRLACSTDPQVPVKRPRRAALAPRAALWLGLLVLALGVVLAAHLLLSNANPDDLVLSTASAQASNPVAIAATSFNALAPTDPRAGAETSAGAVVVHVVGAVATPTVVSVHTGARVSDAIDAAGGASADADLGQVNLARVLNDGEQIRIPKLGETLPANADAAVSNPGSSAQAVEGKININTADAAALEQLPGIGPALAQRIVEYRQSHGQFSSLEALTEVSGIGQAKLAALREEATV